jgi:hypothetical protein
MSDVEKSLVDLKAELQDQLYFLQTSSEAFDNGIDIEAKRIATTLRVLLHDKGRSKALLSQLGLKDNFVDTSYLVPRTWVREGEEGSLSDERRIFNLSIDRCYSPVFSDPMQGTRVLVFEAWWNGEVFRDSVGNSFTRKSITLSLAEQDGGAHVDPTLNKLYYALTRAHSHGFQSFDQREINGVVKAVNVRPLPPPHLVIVRQIAHEVLITLNPLYHYSAKDKYPGLHISGLQVVIKPSSDANKQSKADA